MPVGRASVAREVVSESSVAASYFRNFDGDLDFAPSKDAYTITAEPLTDVVDAWRSEIGREASRLRRYAESNLSELPPGCIYKNLEDPAWRMAALIAEVFRHPGISKNAGRLATQSFQTVIHGCLASATPIRFVIAWGQPKRDAGRLKTLGPCADLAELYSIARLGSIILAVQAITHKPTELLVRTGGSRFVPALFTRRTQTEAYDNQRQRLADNLFGPGVISFQAFSDARDTTVPLSIKSEAYEFDDNIIAGKFHTILLNIDWDNIFSMRPEGTAEAPHGLKLPVTVRTWLTSADDESRLKLIRSSIIALTNTKALSHCLRAFQDYEDVLEETLSFMQRVAWLSTKNYLHLHECQGREEADHDSTTSGRSPIRLTVHEKRDRRDIPAILTLGVQGGNLLSQHVLAVIDERRDITFETYAEIHTRDLIPVLVADAPDAERFPFDWLAGSEQPLCFVSCRSNGPKEDIARVLNSWGANG